MEEQGKITVKKPTGIFMLGKCNCLLINGEVYLTIGPDWLLAVVVLSFILSMLISFLAIMAPKTHPFFQYIGFLVFSSLLVSYLITALKNPGIIIGP